MQDPNRPGQRPLGGLVVFLALVLVAGCQSGPQPAPGDATEATTTHTPPAATSSVVIEPADSPTPSTTPAPMPVPPVRIKAGLFTSFKDSEGNVWLPDQGFADGETTERAEDLQIANTKDPALYRTERYSMSSFSYPVPNGKYTVKLHFAETFEGIMGPGERVFSFNVEGHEFKDFDIWVKAGGPERAYVKTVNVDVTDGKLDITFTPKEENPEINGIEILPGA